MKHYVGMIAAAVGLMGMTGCVVIEGDDEQDRQGYTECGDFLAPSDKDYNWCPPGQYCADPTFSECISGCLSNENCAEDQRCIKADGDNVGTCQNEIKRPASNPR